MALKAIGGSNAEIVSKIGEAGRGFVPYFRAEMDIWRPIDAGKNNDIRGIADYHFANALALYVATKPSTDIVDLCKKTNYGQYMGRPDLNSVEGVYCRIIRATYTENQEWLDQELQQLKMCRRGAEPVHVCFGIGPALLHDLFISILTHDEKKPINAAKKAATWYSQRVHKSHATPEGLKYYTSMNAVLLSLYRIAVSRHGIKLDIKDPFLPLDIICYE